MIDCFGVELHASSRHVASFVQSKSQSVSLSLVPRCWISSPLHFPRRLGLTREKNLCSDHTILKMINVLYMCTTSYWRIAKVTIRRGVVRSFGVGSGDRVGERRQSPGGTSEEEGARFDECASVGRWETNETCWTRGTIRWIDKILATENTPRLDRRWSKGTRRARTGRNRKIRSFAQSFSASMAALTVINATFCTRTSMDCRYPRLRLRCRTRTPRMGTDR